MPLSCHFRGCKALLVTYSCKKRNNKYRDLYLLPFIGVIFNSSLMDLTLRYVNVDSCSIGWSRVRACLQRPWPVSKHLVCCRVGPEGQCLVVSQRIIHRCRCYSTSRWHRSVLSRSIHMYTLVLTSVFLSHLNTYLYNNNHFNNIL